MRLEGIQNGSKGFIFKILEEWNTVHLEAAGGQGAHGEEKKNEKPVGQELYSGPPLSTEYPFQDPSGCLKLCIGLNPVNFFSFTRLWQKFPLYMWNTKGLTMLTIK